MEGSWDGIVGISVYHEMHWGGVKHIACGLNDNIDLHFSRSVHPFPNDVHYD